MSRRFAFQRSSFSKLPTWQYLSTKATLKGNLGQIGMETQTMVERPSVFFHYSLFLNSIDKTHTHTHTISWLLDWRGCFGQGISGIHFLPLDFGLGLWRFYTMVVQVESPWEFIAKGLDFGLDLWRLHNSYILLNIFSAHFTMHEISQLPCNNLHTWTSKARQVLASNYYFEWNAHIDVS